jgi:sugar phosphate permease
MALDMFAVLFGGAVAMLPAYADQVLHVGSQGLGALRAAPALGSIVTALALAMWPLKRIRAALLLWAITGFGICMIGFGLSNIFWLSMLFLALSGMFDSISVVMRATIMQLLTPDSMRGRVSSVNSMFIISSNEIGAFRSGTTASIFGLVPSVVMGGVITLMVVSATALWVPKLRRTVVDATES